MLLLVLTFLIVDILRLLSFDEGLNYADIRLGNEVDVVLVDQVLNKHLRGVFVLPGDSKWSVKVIKGSGGYLRRRGMKSLSKR